MFRFGQIMPDLFGLRCLSCNPTQTSASTPCSKGAAPLGLVLGRLDGCAPKEWPPIGRGEKSSES